MFVNVIYLTIYFLKYWLLILNFLVITPLQLINSEDNIILLLFQKCTDWLYLETYSWSPRRSNSAQRSNYHVFIQIIILQRCLNNTSSGAGNKNWKKTKSKERAPDTESNVCIGLLVFAFVAASTWVAFTIHAFTVLRRATASTRISHREWGH